MNAGDKQTMSTAGKQGPPPEVRPASSRKPGAPDEAAESKQQERGAPHQSHISRISREEAERNLAPDPDPDDPVSP